MIIVIVSEKEERGEKENEKSMKKERRKGERRERERERWFGEHLLHPTLCIKSFGA